MTPTQRDGTTPLDPDRRRPPPPAPPGYRSVGSDKRFGSCGNCGALINLVDLAAKLDHEQHHVKLNDLWAAVQLSGSVEASTVPRLLPPDPDPKSPPTPLPGDHSRGGVGGSNQPTQAGAGPPPSDATVAPGTGRPVPGAAQRSRPGVARESRPGRELTLDEIEQLAYEERQAGKR